jgi:hypothetical protein
VGSALGADAELRRALRQGGYLHDVGKIAVPDRVLLKPGPLETAERRLIETHPGAGADLVRGLRTLEAVRPIIRHHHERMDGSGYPDGLRGEAIPLGARIMAVVDVYDALHTERPYKPALSHEESAPCSGTRPRPGRGTRGWWRRSWRSSGTAAPADDTRRGASPPFRSLPPGLVAPAKPALERRSMAESRSGS